MRSVLSLFLLAGTVFLAVRLVPQVAVPYRLVKLQFEPADALIAMPVDGVRKAKVANTWGANRPGNRKHQGQDIFARRGTPVRSATGGIVVRISEGGLGGKAVWVAGRGGRSYYYAHLDDFAPELQTGDIVSPYTVLGYVGTTGNARNTPPHLHFGVYTRTGAMDPLPLLMDRVSSETVKQTPTKQTS